MGLQQVARMLAVQRADCKPIVLTGTETRVEFGQPQLSGEQFAVRLLYLSFTHGPQCGKTKAFKVG